MARIYQRPSFGDKVAIMERTQHGLIIARFGYFMADGFGCPNYGRSKVRDGVLFEYQQYTESDKYSAVMILDHNGDGEWHRAAYEKNLVMFDSSAVRFLDEETRKREIEAQIAHSVKYHTDDNDVAQYIEDHIIERLTAVKRKNEGYVEWRRVVAVMAVTSGAVDPITEEQAKEQLVEKLKKDVLRNARKTPVEL